MTLFNKSEPFILFLGDAAALFLALWLTLLVRYAALPGREIFYSHVLPFSILFVVWVGVFFIAGMYEKHTLILKRRLGSLLLRTQIANSVIAVLFFYFIPYFGITPKTNLFLYLLISFLLIWTWRILVIPALGMRKREKAILIGSGEEMRELYNEVNQNPRYSLTFSFSIDLSRVADGERFEERMVEAIQREDISTVVIDVWNEKVMPVLPQLYNLLFSHIRFIDKYRIYEDIFDRVPLSLVRYNWFLENISSSRRMVYDMLKRTMDVTAALVCGLISLVVYPFVYAAVKYDDGGPLFFIGERIGQGGRTIKLLKFRSMSTKSRGGGIEEAPHVTRVGKFLRHFRIDELPQLWNVLRGDISIVGPRPETPELVALYEKEIPYYHIRHLIKPGLSGWAQIHHEEHPHHGADVKETKRKLSYDLYYIKNRSFFLDLKIALKTIKTILSRSGR